MNYSLLTSIAQTLAGNSTIPPDTKDLSAGTVASVVITGVVVVFIALILLIIFVSIYGKIFDSINKSKAAKASAKAESEAAAAKQAASVSVKSVTPAAPVIEDGISEETVAVIMAAVCAMEGANGKNLVLKSVKTAKPQRPVWSSAGIIENTRPF